MLIRYCYHKYSIFFCFIFSHYMKMNFYESIENMENLLYDKNYCTIADIYNSVQKLVDSNIFRTEDIMKDMIDLLFVDEIKEVIRNDDIRLYFGKTLRDLKLVITDSSLRQHEVLIKYLNLEKLQITSVNLPHSVIQDRIYITLQEIVFAFKKHIESLSSYFYELEQIDISCNVVEPMSPSFKDEFRRILLDERIYLHLEVSPEGMATNVHLIGQSELWNNKLQKGLLSWDHDKTILENIMDVFDITEFPLPSKSSSATLSADLPQEMNMCGICLCFELPDDPGVPLPLCQNDVCGRYFHRNCLYQWLVACAGGRPPTLGVANGSCPACYTSITCSERDI